MFFRPFYYIPIQLAEASIQGTPFDLHVLSTPPAFVLSQDQTLNKMVSKQTTQACPNHSIEAILASKTVYSLFFG